MSQIEYSQTLGQQEEMEYLLTKESLVKWYKELFKCDFDNLSVLAKRDNVRLYLQSHGLPADSIIKGVTE